MAALGALLPAAVAAAQPVVFYDPVGDAVVRRTDEGNNGSVNSAQHRLPDIVEMRMGRFAPTTPYLDLFAGNWSNGGGFMRFDMVLAGLINPPGPMSFDFKAPYTPFMYGPNPIFGWVEFDVDHNVDTGGELSNPELRYYGAIARFGGKPVGAEFGDRIAMDETAFIPTKEHDPPLVSRSGEEFHLAFRGEDIYSIEKVNEKPGGDVGIFESGEQWTIHGPMWHRAHCFERYAFQCVGQEGHYLPVVSVRFKHDNASNQTTISLVYPLTNTAWGMTQWPTASGEGNNGCPGDQNSIEEALTDLQFSAMFTDPIARSEPEFALIAGWETANISSCLDPALWRVNALVGTGYAAPEPSGATYVWTDAWPNCRVGDFNGDGQIDAADAAMVDNYIASRDGVSGLDADAVVNGRVVIPDFASSFSIFDTNYDGVVGPEDTIVLGDMNINLVANYADIGDFVQALVNPGVYTLTHGGASPLLRGDLNGDHRMDGKDIPLMLGVVGCH